MSLGNQAKGRIKFQNRQFQITSWHLFKFQFLGTQTFEQERFGTFFPCCFRNSCSQIFYKFKTICSPWFHGFIRYVNNIIIVYSVLHISAVFLFLLFGGIACFHRRLLFITACHGILTSVIPCWNKTKTNKILPNFLMNEWIIKRRNLYQHFTKTFYVLFRRKYKIYIILSVLCTLRGV